MAQVTWRAEDAVVERARRASQARGWSLNEYVTRVLDVATDPARAAGPLEEVRERLAGAGLLEVSIDPVPAAPDPASFQAARRRAGRGRPLSEHVDADRS